MKRALPFLLLLLLAAACGPTVKTSYDYDKTADFTKFKTYAFTEETMKLGVNQLDRDRLIAATTEEMEKRGFTKSESPDVLVDIHIRIEKKQDATATTSGTGMYGGYGGMRYGYGGGFTTTQINYNDYIVGTVFVNIVEKDKLVWQGRGEKTLDETASPEKREANIKSGVAAIFKKYPVQPPPAKK